MKKILVTGGNGLVGNAISQIANNYPEYEFIFCVSENYNLTKEKEVKELFDRYKPNYVIHTAAKVGGLGGHVKYQYDYFYDNILINSYVINYAIKNKVEKFIGLSSVCGFSEKLSTLNEELFHYGEPFLDNYSYGYTKRIMDVQISSCNKQFGIVNFCSLISGNIFGENDLYNTEYGHVVPSLIHKIYSAKKNQSSLFVWGDGSCTRELLYSKDLALIIMNILNMEFIPQRFLVAGNSLSIKNLIILLCEVSNFTGDIVWDTDKPTGNSNRNSDISFLKSKIKVNLTDFKDSLKNSYDWFCDNYPKVRM